MPSTNSTNLVETVVIDSPSLQILCSHSHAGPILFVVWDILLYGLMLQDHIRQHGAVYVGMLVVGCIHSLH